jgi:hypothetical protein
MRWLGPESVPDTYLGSRKNYLVSRVSWVLWRPSIPSARTTSGLRSRLFFFVLYDNSLQLLALFPIAVFYSGTLVALPTLGRECMRSVGANMVGLSGGISSGVVVRGGGYLPDHWRFIGTDEFGEMKGLCGDSKRQRRVCVRRLCCI